MSTTKPLNELVSAIFESAPADEMAQVSRDLLTLLSLSDSVINSSMEKSMESKFTVLSEDKILSPINKLKGTTKYIDYIEKKTFNVQPKTQSIVDLEDLEVEVDYPEYFQELVEELKVYGNRHYPSKFAFTVVPDGSKLHVLTIGLKISTANFYTGSWKSLYTIDNGQIQANITLDVHYFEDGNVHLKFSESANESLSQVGSDSIVKKIHEIESKVTKTIVHDFNDLNTSSFKNLRRLLPVTRSKINWGNAIGNYRLGSDVVNK